MQAGIQVEGLAELRRGLKKAEDIDNLGGLRDGLKKAADVVAQDAKSRVPSRSGRAAGTIRATAGGNAAFVKGGGAKAPYYGWLDFGSRTPQSGNPRSVGPWTRSGKGPMKGRFIYPAFEARGPQVKALIEHAVSETLRKAGL